MDRIRIVVCMMLAVAASVAVIVLAGCGEANAVSGFPPVPTVCHQGALCYGVIGGTNPRFNSPTPPIGCTSSENLDALNAVTGNHYLTPAEIAVKMKPFLTSGRCRYFTPFSFVRQIGTDAHAHAIMKVLTGPLAGKTLYTIDPTFSGGGLWCGGCAT